MRRRLIVLSVLAVAALVGLPAVPSSASSAGAHAAITITSDAGFSACGCVTSGNGSAASPYVIGPWAIAAPSGGTSGWSVKVDNSAGVITAYFSIFGISSTYNDTNTTDPTIWLVDVHTATTISGTSASPTGGNDLSMGIELDGSSGISIDGVSYNKDNGTGIYLNGSANVSINNAKLKSTCTLCTPHNGDGIYAVNSAGLQIGTGSDCPSSNPCNDVTYDDGFGIWLVNTHDTVINQADADANDTGGFVLDGPDTYNVTLENSVSHATGNICITFNGQRVNTGYHTDLQGGLHIVNGAHDNTIASDDFSGRTSGISVGSGGNGFFANACAGVDQPFSPVEAAMGPGNTFSNLCYSTTDVSGLPPSTCRPLQPQLRIVAAVQAAYPPSPKSLGNPVRPQGHEHNGGKREHDDDRTPQRQQHQPPRPADDSGQLEDEQRDQRRRQYARRIPRPSRRLPLTTHATSVLPRTPHKPSRRLPPPVTGAQMRLRRVVGGEGVSRPVPVGDKRQAGHNGH